VSKVLKTQRPARRAADEEHWIPLSDLMTGLMFLFLLISLAYMVQVQHQAAGVARLSETYRDTRSRLYADLEREFRGDFKRWNAELTPDLVIRFNAPDVLFESGSDELRPRFKEILSDFFPRYVHLLASPPYRDSLKEVRIEGHTSSGWEPGASALQAFMGNMALSQGRTRSVLGYVLGLPAVQPQEQWLMTHVTANGLSSAHPILVNGKEDQVRSQRVEFRAVDNLQERIQHLDEAKAAAPQAASAALPRPGKAVFYSVDTLAAPQSDPVTVAADDQARIAIHNGQPVEIDGWATDRVAKKPAGGVYIGVDKKKYVKAEYGLERDDVAAALGDPDRTAVGYSVTVPAELLKTGSHALDLIVLNADGIGFFVAPNRIVIDVQP
jgi:outer membrane protein OmpA-like peptidoglycan-associated protein